MATSLQTDRPPATPVPTTLDRKDKGLKSGALGLVSSVVIGVASTAPAYSLAATLGAIALAVGLLSPLIAVIAFIPMLLISIGYSELNKVDPDCGTTFTWSTRAFGPRIGWLGGWGIIASDVLVMASLAQVSGQYGFLLVNANGIGNNPTSAWVLLLGVSWLAAMTWICFRGIEVSATVQRILLSIEVVMLVVFAVVALFRVATGDAPHGYLTPSLSWFNPLHGHSFSNLVDGLILMLFIYWGWDTSLSINEETADKERLPGLAGIISTVVLLSIYFIVTLAAQSFAGVGSTGIGLANPAHVSDVLSVLGTAVFGSAVVGQVFSHLLLLMVLSSAAASAQTTILPTARTALSMGTYKALPDSFGHVHRRYLTPTVATFTMGGISILMYAVMNYLSGGYVIADSVTAIGIWIAFYYGLTGFACTWYFRKVLTRSRRDLWMKAIMPTLGGVILYAAMIWSIKTDWSYSSNVSYTSWQLPFPPHSDVGGVFLVFFASLLVGLVAMAYMRFASPSFFRGETLNSATPTLVPEDTSVPVAPMVDGESASEDAQENRDR
ncbi:MAG: APC family permease [Acidimicrobiales bacterium]|jgi:amino acid transporter